MKDSQRQNRRQAGFTLVEIMVVVVILGLLATMVTQSVLGANDEANEGVAASDISTIKDAADMYKIRNRGRTPEIVDLITTDDKGVAYIEGYDGAEEILDPWGNAYEIRADGAQIEVISFGPDGLADTDDDLSSRRKGAQR